VRASCAWHHSNYTERILYFTAKFAANFIMFDDKLGTIWHLLNISNDKNFSVTIGNIKKTFYIIYIMKIIK